MVGGLKINFFNFFFLGMQIPSERSKWLVDVLNGFLFLQIRKQKRKKEKQERKDVVWWMNVCIRYSKTLLDLPPPTFIWALGSIWYLGWTGNYTCTMVETQSSFGLLPNIMKTSVVVSIVGPKCRLVTSLIISPFQHQFL